MRTDLQAEAFLRMCERCGPDWYKPVDYDALKAQLSARLRERPDLITARGDGDRTALMNASQTTLPGIIPLLVEAGCDVNAQDESGWTALMFAAVSNRMLHDAEELEVVAVLLRYGARVDMRSRGGRTALHPAAHRPDNKVARLKLLLAHGGDPSARDKEGQTPLHNAIYGKAALALLEAGADPNAMDNSGQTPLTLMAMEGAASAVRALLAHGADVNVRDPEGKTPLHLIVHYEDVLGSGITRLLKAGADHSARDRDGRTPLHIAAGTHCLQGIFALNKAGADINARDAAGMTPLGLVEAGIFTGVNDYYGPPPYGEGDPKIFAKGQAKIARILRSLGGVV